MKETKRKNTSLFAKLKNYSESDYYAFHMPGHKRNLDLMQGTSPYRIDITEIDGFDDLHHAEGILKEAQERAARKRKSVFSVSGIRKASAAGT